MKRTWLGFINGCWALIIFSMGLSPAQAGEAGAVAATLDGVAITLEELDQLTGARVAALNEQTYQLQRQTLEGLINERLLSPGGSTTRNIRR